MATDPQITTTTTTATPFLTLTRQESTNTLTCTLNSFPKDASFMLSWRYNDKVYLSGDKFLNTEHSGTNFKHVATKIGTYTCEVGNGDRVIDTKTMTVSVIKDDSSSKFLLFISRFFFTQTLSRKRG